ncbi:uncharacterized protein DS421_10g300030 [Arachis hypogaea]|uniref:Ubiquitin-like protease family profile domain-containing protein n=1 Tax=Arachis hypogaea TaxID=3818 RepID=A0A445B7A5_ARAHY|nr:uncharacterized protein DS421_10g300030 [Arachis hypogaea]RYR34559.1 hypothetical protein Ahy_A10g049507 [Arachis hypogaea]
MSLMPKEQVHASVVRIHSMILNQIKVQQYQEQMYIVLLDIVNFMLGRHDVEYTDKRINKAYRFDIEQYAHHPIFLQKKTCIASIWHWWLWIANVNKKKFYIIDPINKPKQDIPESRVQLNKFVGLIIFHMKVYARAEPLMEDGLGEEVEYIQLNGQRTEVLGYYDCIFTDVIDDFRYQYGPNLLLHEMNKIKDQVIWESKAIRLSKPTVVLSSLYCKFTSGDLDSK